MENISSYRYLSSVLNVSAIAKRIEFRFAVETPQSQVWEMLMEQLPQVALVTHEGAPVGYVELSDIAGERSERPIEEVMNVIEIWRVVSAETSLFELIPLWERSYYFFVLSGTQITHIISRHDMDNPTVKATLFALTAELESAILRLLLADQDKVAGYFSLLEGDKRKSAKSKSLKKKQPDHALAHIQNLYFSDKKEILLRSPELVALMPCESVDDLRSFFDLVVALRNELAHGGSLFNVIRDASELRVLIEDMERVRVALVESWKDARQTSQR